MDIWLCENGAMHSRTDRLRSMQRFFPLIFLTGQPAQIFCTVINPLTVAVRSELSSRTRTVKGFAN